MSVKQNTIPGVDSEIIFQALDSPYIVFAADYPDLTIIAQNAAHAKVSYKEPGQVIGQKLLDAYPDTSDEYIRTGKSPLVKSIRKAITTGKPDTMPDMRYDLMNEQGVQITKFWAVTHYPVFKDGVVAAVYQDTKDITEEKQIEQKLDDTKSQLDEVLATSRVGTWAWDINAEKVVADSNLSRMFGIRESKARVGLPLDTFIKSIYEPDRERVQQQIHEALQSLSRTYEAEYRTVTTQGEIKWVLARGSVKSDQTGKPTRFSGTIIDITDRKEAEREVRESENRLRFMADSMPQLVWVTRADGFHEYYNKRWYDYTGTEPGTTDGDGWSELFHPNDQARAWKAWRKSLKTGEPYEIEYRLFNAPTNRYRWVIGRAMPLRNDAGEIIKWYGTCTDIDEQKRLGDQQEFLANASKELAMTLDTRKLLSRITKLSVPIVADWCTVDLYDEIKGFEQVSVAHTDPKKIKLAREYRDHNPLHVNDDTAIPRMLKSGKPEFYPVITDTMLKAYIQDKETLDFMLSLNLCSIMIVPLKVGKKTVGAISFISSDSGRYFSEADYQMANELAVRLSLSMTNAKLYDSSQGDLKRRRELERQLRVEKQTLESRVKERTQQLQLTNQGLRDEILKRQNAEKELNLYSSELTRSNQELENFAYVASHDLQEPLRKIQAFGNLLLTEYGESLGEEGADYLQRMHSAASRMSTLIEDLLMFSRVTRKAPATQNVNLEKVLSDVLSDLETRIKDTGAEINVGKLPTVCADPTHMRQLLQNVVGNALKFHRPGASPVVNIQARAKKHGHEITISDNGIGFDEKYLDRIFSVFQRLNERSSYEGTGIGLAVCRKIVERYGGTITAESSKGNGAKFIIWLPEKKGHR